MKKKAPGTVVTIILTLITILFWAGYVTYQAIRKPVKYEVDPEIIKPFSASLDTETLDKLPSRIYFEESQLPESVIVETLPEETTTVEVASESASPTPTPETSPSPQATQSATP